MNVYDSNMIFDIVKKLATKSPDNHKTYEIVMI